MPASPSAAPSLRSPCAAFVCASRPHFPATSPCSTWTAAFCRPATSAHWDQGTLTPLATVIPVEYSRLVDIIGEGGPKVVSENPVTKTLADVAVQMAKNRDQFLQQAGDGKIGQVDPSYAGGGANPIVLASQPWGARLVSQGQQVQVMSNTYTLRGTCYVNNVNNKLGLGAVHNRGRGARGHRRRRLHHGRGRGGDHPGIPVRHSVFP